MPNKLYAIKYNGADCLIHLKYDEHKMTVNILSDELARDIHISSFEVNHGGELVTPAIGGNISVEAIKDLYSCLLNNVTESGSINTYDSRRSAA
jgi:hypothetical protein